ncbi:MAG: alkaline phosphatase PhoX [Pseudomonadota bacterium]
MPEYHPATTTRRQFLRWGSRSFATFLAGAGAVPFSSVAATAEPLFADLSQLGELMPPDSNGLRLPHGFRSRIIAHSNQRVLKTDNTATDYLWHNAPDGGACFATDDGGWIYVSNSEIKIIDGGGGVGAIRFNAAGDIVDAYSLLTGTDNNCAGGKTPWQSWLSCEEVDRGQVYECNPAKKSEGTVRPALGRFKHEAVAVDPDASHLYLTEDEMDGCFYRFVPAQALPNLDSGTLQVAEVIQVGQRMRIRWHDVPDPAATTIPTRSQIAEATRFNGGEGIAWTDGLVYFTTKGDNRVWRLDTRNNDISVLYDAATAATPHLSGVDNVTITASGDVLVAEDGGDMQIVLLSANGAVIPLVQITGQDDSEICGPAFDPTFQRFYFSSQTGPLNRDDDGITYEISRIS